MSVVITIALASLRHRARSSVATAATLFLGATIVMAFASLLDTAAADSATSTDRETLLVMAIVVGLIAAVIVTFAAASAMTLAIRSRADELRLLEALGSTPGQQRRGVVVEATLAALACVAAAVGPAWLVGHVTVGLLADGDRVGATLDHRFGPIALGFGLVTTLGAAVVGARRAAGRARRATVRAETGTRLPLWRKIVAGVFLALGIENAVLTMTIFHGKGSEAMQTGGQASIWVAIGLAILAPALARAGVKVVAPTVGRLGGEVGELVVHNLRRRSGEMARPLMPIILFTAIGVGTITMQAIEDGAAAASGAPAALGDRNIATVNLIVVALVTLFAGVMVLNTLVAATSARGREMGQLRLLGLTDGETTTLVGLETAVLVAVGVLAGTVAAVFTVVPYSVHRTGDLLPPSVVTPWIGVAGGAAVLAIGAAVGTCRRLLRTRPVAAVAAA